MAAKKASTAKKDAGVKRAPNRGRSPATNEGGSVPVAGPETEVVVRGRVASALFGGKKRAAQIVEPDSKLARDGDTDVIRVKAIRVGYYGHKLRKVGEVFDLHTNPKAFKEVPSWTIDLQDAEVGQDEGTRGLHSGGREDDRIREERLERTDTKKFKKGKGADKIVDPTIIEDALPLSEGGNEVRPSSTGNEKVV
jgi:hypothetical protein